MARPSKLDKLDPTIREAIVRLRERGHTIDEIMAHLDTVQLLVLPIRFLKVK